MVRSSYSTFKDRCERLSRARLTGHRISLTTWDDLVAKPRMSGIVFGVPTPMYFVGAAPIIDKILSRLSVDFTQESTKELEDQNDTLVIHPSSDSTTDLPQSDVSTLQPKRIIALTNDAFPPRDKTPTFDIALYWVELKTKEQGFQCQLGPSLADRSGSHVRRSGYKHTPCLIGSRSL